MKDNSILQLQCCRAAYYRKKYFYSLSFKERWNLSKAHTDWRLKTLEASDNLLTDTQIEEKIQEYSEATRNIKRPWWDGIAKLLGI